MLVNKNCRLNTFQDKIKFVTINHISNIDNLDWEDYGAAGVKK